MERRYCAGGKLSLGDYAPLVTALDAWQARAVARPSFLGRFPRAPLAQCQDTLKFLATLDDLQIAQMGGDGLAGQNLNVVQQSALLYALRESIWSGAVSPALLKSCFVGVFDGPVLLKLEIAPDAAKPFMGDPEWSPMAGPGPWRPISAARYTLSASVDGQEITSGARIDQVEPFQLVEPENDPISVPAQAAGKG